MIEIILIISILVMVFSAGLVVGGKWIKRITDKEIRRLKADKFMCLYDSVTFKKEREKYDRDLYK